MAPEEVAATLPESLTWGTEAVARILEEVESSQAVAGNRVASVAFLACRPSPGSRAAAAALAARYPKEEVLLKVAAAGSRAAAAESSRARP